MWLTIQFLVILPFRVRIECVSLSQLGVSSCWPDIGSESEREIDIDKR